jgi:hypothetical protein
MHFKFFLYEEALGMPLHEFFIGDKLSALVTFHNEGDAVRKG